MFDFPEVVEVSPSRPYKEVDVSGKEHGPDAYGATAEQKATASKYYLLRKDGHLISSGSEEAAYYGRQRDAGNISDAELASKLADLAQ